MLPLVLAPDRIQVGLIGRGSGRDRRAAFLADSGVDAVTLPETPSDAALKPLAVLFMAGLEENAARDLADRARALGVLVNVEDVPALCDFHVPARVCRGDLLLTVSTGGKAPGLARVLREWLGERFGPEWAGRLNEIAVARARFRAEGLSSNRVLGNVREQLAQMGWS